MGNVKEPVWTCPLGCGCDFPSCQWCAFGFCEEFEPIPKKAKEPDEN
jgi:hypothetical protein